MYVDFERYGYYPALRTRAAELGGLKQLTRHEKEKIVPLITLGKWPRSEDIQVSLDKVVDAMGDLPFILDVTRESKHHCENSASLLSPENNFSAWRNFVSQKDNIVPVVQITDSARIRDITMQAREFETTKNSLAFRITNPQRDIQKVISSLATLDSPEKAIVFIDLGYIRGNIPIVTTAAVSAINQLRQEIPETIISVLSTSFPSTVTTFCREDGRSGEIDIIERELFQTIGGRDICIYGDHGSIHAVVYDETGGRYVPRIDLPFDDSWYFERRSGEDSSGYIDAARAILREYPDLAEDDSWGAGMIKNAANGEIEGMGSPAKWIAVRVNMHISRQILLSDTIAENPIEEDDDFY
ncbi:beta family protein [Pseudomonas syringae]|uniref:beta family protein n=1 Tax=Pseudomonas syringae TaxID=317 RepID=UPI000CDB4E23|nr:beta family protein [Pseudomonas syringae]POP69008.1 protein beta [Pseudomonas syringae]